MNFEIIFKSYEKDSLSKAKAILKSLKVKDHLSFHSLPSKISKATLLRSPHIDKKSREQIQLKTYQTSVKFSNIENVLFFLSLVESVKVFKLENVQCKCKIETKTPL